MKQTMNSVQSSLFLRFMTWTWFIMLLVYFIQKIHHSPTPNSHFTYLNMYPLIRPVQCLTCLPSYLHFRSKDMKANRVLYTLYKLPTRCFSILPEDLVKLSHRFGLVKLHILYCTIEGRSVSVI